MSNKGRQITRTLSGIHSDNASEWLIYRVCLCFFIVVFTQNDLDKNYYSAGAIHYILEVMLTTVHLLISRMNMAVADAFHLAALNGVIR